MCRAVVPDPGPGGKNCKKKLLNCKEIGTGSNYNFIKIEVNLDKLHGFLLLSNLFVFFNSRKLFIR